MQLEGAKSIALKEAILKKINLMYPQKDLREMEIEAFHAISDWYHLVIRNLTEVEGFELSPKNIAKKLKISEIDAGLAIERLLRLNLLEQVPNKKHLYRKTKDSILAKSDSPNIALRNFHRQMLEKAIESLQVQLPQEKIVGSETFSFSPKHLPEANKIAEEFFQKMLSLSKRAGKKTHVYHLGVQFFNLTKGEEK